MGLEFQQTNSEVSSKNFTGFSIRRSQQLEGSLPGVHTYIILVDDVGNEKVLIPRGKVGRTGNITPTAFDGLFQVFVYNVHRRFRHLKASSTIARLQIASMYAATSSYLPDSRSNKTGMHTAIELVRR
jgi:hypothetical protein